jgi:hypothetical protein
MKISAISRPLSSEDGGSMAHRTPWPRLRRRPHRPGRSGPIGRAASGWGQQGAALPSPRSDRPTDVAVASSLDTPDNLAPFPRLRSSGHGRNVSVSIDRLFPVSGSAAVSTRIWRSMEVKVGNQCLGSLRLLARRACLSGTDPPAWQGR